MSGQRPQQTSGPDHPSVPQPPDPLDTSAAHVARRYNYLLGGKDHYGTDRASAERITAAFPTIATAVAENRAFLHRTVRYLAEHGIRQFLDIGTGLPTSDNSNTHQIAQQLAPTSRIVYVDNDPIVLAHARALLTGTPQGTIGYLDADLRQPDSILDSQVLRNTLDLTQPVGLLLLAVLHFIPDTDDPYNVVARLAAGMPTGSYLVLSHATNQYMTGEQARTAETAASAGSQAPFLLRSRQQIASLLGGMDIVEPGLVSVADWRADREPQPRPSPADTAVLGGVARIPYGHALGLNDPPPTAISRQERRKWRRS